MAKREYVEANKRWLEEKAKEEGVMALPRGIYYKVLKQGDPKGAQPSRRSIVTAHYTGWTINGKKFDSSRGGTPFAMRLSDRRCTWATSGNFTSQPRWDTASSRSRASQAVLP